MTKPTVLVLPDNSTSLLTASKGFKCSPVPALSNTPLTPSLLPTQTVEDEDEGWEHVPSSPRLEAETLDGMEGEDEDVIVLGELELERELEALDMRGDAKKRKSGERKGLSYAAALGATR